MVASEDQLDCRTEKIVCWIRENSERSTSAAWNCIYHRCSQSFESVLRSIGAVDKNDCRDTMHEAMAELFFNVANGKFRGDSKLCTYLIGIGKNLWLKKKESQKKMVYRPDFEMIDPKSENINASDGMSSIRDALAASPCADILFEYYFVHDAHYGRLADAVKRPHEDRNKVYERVRKQVNRCLDKVRSSLGNGE